MYRLTLNSLLSSSVSRSVLAFFMACLLGPCHPAIGTAGDGYRINSGDKLDIAVWQEEKLHLEVVVLPDGTISFPLVGHVPAAGKTTDELAALLRERLGQMIRNPEVNVRVVAAEGNSVYVIGQVVRPGEIVMKGHLHVMQALSMAGGFTIYADKNDIRILRHGTDGRIQALPFEYSEVENGENLESDIQLQSGDTIVVP